MTPKNIEKKKEAYNVANDNIHTPLNDECIVISGMAGKFPDSDDIYHFRDNLLSKADLVSTDYRRWKLNHPEIPERHGKINGVHNFDAGAFGVNQRHGSETDPMLRHLLERSFEAILDAGYNPSELAGTNTGVFVGANFSDQENEAMFSGAKPNAFPCLGNTRSMLAQRLSYYYKLTGPSYITDTACSSSMFAVEHAYRALIHGQCEKAIVGGASLCLRPMATLKCSRLGTLSMDGKCKCFDDAADGYVRAEAISAIFLEKSKGARRIYAHLIHTKTNCDGFKEYGITYPSAQMQTILMKEVYEECSVSPSDVVFVEAHGTGTLAGDLTELETIDKVFCSDRKQPLYIGSAKANIGHTEPSSGLCSIIKILIGFECGYIPPNINFEKNRQGAIGLEKGRMKVLTKKLPLAGTTGIVGVNNFGFGGTNAHVVLRWNQKVKCSDGLKDSIPRLVCVSGRTQEAIEQIFHDLETNDLDAEFIKLLHTVFRENISGHVYRGFSLVSKTEEIQRSINCLGIGDYKKLCLVFSNFDKKLLKMGSHLLALPPFANSIRRVQIGLLKECNIDILDSCGNFIQETAISAILGSVAVQIGLADTLKELAIRPDSVFGIGIGDLIAAYYVEFLTLEETLLLTHFVTLQITEKYKEKNMDYLLQELIESLDVTLKERKISPNWLPCHQSHDLVQGSVNYFFKNIINPISFDQVYRTMSSGSAVFVIGSKPNQQNVISIKDDQKNYLNSFLICLGTLYENGFNMELDRLYPKIDFPLSRGTRMLSPLIKWDHSRAWKVYTYNNQELMRHGSYNAFISKKENDWAFVAGHIKDGKNLFPATGYLRLVWETLSLWKEQLVNDLKVVFEDVRFMRATNVPDKGVLHLVIHLHYQSDCFEITEGDKIIVTGKVYEATDDTNDLTALPVVDTHKLEPVMDEKDIYKELRVRGYHYTGKFRCLKECNMSATKGVIQWVDNYVSFMDNMLQMEILQIDTRNIYEPTSIDMVIIDPKEHTKIAVAENNAINVYINRESNILRSGAIEIRGLTANVIHRKKNAEPVLQSYKFIPNQAKLSTNEAISVIVQTIIENNPVVQVKSVELSDDSNNLPLLSPLIQKCFEDLPLVQQETIVLSKIDVDLPGIVVKDKKLFEESNCMLVVGRTMLEQPQVLETALNCTKEKGGFILSRESLLFDASNIRNNDVTVICVYENENETLILLRKSTAYTIPASAIDMSDCWGSLNWLPTLQNIVKKKLKVVVYAQNHDDSGILGFTNCLKREVNCSKISCFVLGNGAPQFDLNHPFYKKQLHKNMAINVWKDEKWGTYRYLLLDQCQSIQTDHRYVNATVYGNLSSLKWIEGSLSAQSKVKSNRTLVQVYSAAINFRDVMMATGRISADVVVKNRSAQEYALGIEFSGKDTSGKRLMGIVDNGGLSTLVMADNNLLWPIPDHWSMEDAATVPVVYGTVLYALLMRANAKRSQTILIHSGAGGVGQAAINIALHYGLTVFTTVGTKEKRNFIRQHFPEVPKCHVGNSRDCSFEQMVSNATRGRGVDIVLNSLAEEKLLASVRCVAKGGTFLEIGKFDLSNNNELALQLFQKEVTFERVMLDTLFLTQANAKAELGNCLLKAITDGAVKPLSRSIFKVDEIEQAFKFMTAGKHIGKVLIQVRKDAEVKEESVLKQVNTFPRFHANPEATYIIVGGLGGFGLELADHLILRGARNLVLSSRTGISNGYQAFRIKNWKSLDANIIICTDDVTTKEGCTSIIKTATKFGPVEGIFNLAVVLEDSLFESQTIGKFKKTLAPKALITKYFDVISRNLCPQLRYFVIFSSGSCGRGNAGQTNYGMANSIIERICERRKVDGYPALAIQWGAIGDVGIVAQMQEDQRELVIGGTLQQKIANCLEVLDVFLKQNEPIVSSMVVAEKKSSTGQANTVMETVINIIGVHDLKTVSIHASFSELGMDSMMTVEIKQTLEREYGVLLTPQDIRMMTLARLQELSEVNKSVTPTNESNLEEEPTSNLLHDGFQLLIKNLGDETSAIIPVIHMTNTLHKNKNTPKIFALPGIDGMAAVLNTLIKNINGNVTCLQFCARDCPDSITEMAKSLTRYVDLSNSNTFILIAYSFGTLVATELVRILEKRGYFGKVVFIDGGPELMLRMAKLYFNFRSDEEFQLSLICFLMRRYVSLMTILKSKAELEKCKSFEERLQLVGSTIQNSQYSNEYMTESVIAIYKRLNAVLKYKPNFDKLKSELKLIKPTTESIRGIESDYKLTELFENVHIKVFGGDHATILENPDVSAEVNKFIHVEHTEVV